MGSPACADEAALTTWTIRQAPPGLSGFYMEQPAQLGKKPFEFYIGWLSDKQWGEILRYFRVTNRAQLVGRSFRTYAHGGWAALDGLGLVKPGEVYRPAP